jgi:N6-L-threonylcarbamoyladenine synthase
MKENKKIILGLESSCDETAAALVLRQGQKFEILANLVFSQIAIHKKFGGVVPEVAARNHIKKILPVLEQTLKQAKISPSQISSLAATTGPGLVTSLLVGLETAKTLAYVWQKPIVPVNHLRAHVYANWLNNQKILFPAVCLLVSGGHTELILLTSPTKLKKIGQTLDDAAGEAFDKVAALLNIGYPGGPVISQLALKGNPNTFALARPMLNRQDFNFSFSGLKTSVLYTFQKLKNKDLKTKADLCASFQQATVDVLTTKTMKAALAQKAKTVMLSGGVAANQLLRQTLEEKVKKQNLKFLMPPINLCTDNAAMVACAGFFAKPEPWPSLSVDPNLEI